MTTDITELALRLKIEVHRAVSNFNPQMNIKTRDLKELVEALENAQQVEEELCKLLPPGAEYMDPPDGGDVTPLEGVRRMVADYRQRIAELENYAEAEAVGADKVAENAVYWMKRCKELESRTVKLPDLRQIVSGDRYVWSDGVYNYSQDVKAILADAGIKVEAE